MTQFVLSIVIGCLFSVGTFLILRRDLIKVVWGTIILSQSANIYLIAIGGLNGAPPILSHSSGHGTVTDPVVQALVLTAIVIGFATTAFVLVLTYRIYQEHSTLDLDKIGSMDREVSKQK